MAVTRVAPLPHLKSIEIRQPKIEVKKERRQSQRQKETEKERDAFIREKRDDRLERGERR